MMNNITKIGALYVSFSKHIKHMTISFPFAILIATDSGITIKWLWIRYEINKSSITSISKHGYLPPLDNGIQIVHTYSELPELLIFKCFNRNKLLSDLQHLGYPIDDID